MTSYDRKRELLAELIAMERSVPTKIVRHPLDVVPILVKRFGKKKQEHFVVITLNGAHGIIRVRAITIGLVNRTLVHPREVFQTAIRDNASAIIVAHNHPSGRAIASDEDRRVTETLKEAGKIVGIPVLDHIIFTGNGSFVSELDTLSDFSISVSP